MMVLVFLVLMYSYMSKGSYVHNYFNNVTVLAMKFGAALGKKLTIYFRRVLYYYIINLFNIHMVEFVWVPLR